ncbi:MAG: ferritin-like domain-containing protein [Gemmatimonadales bacterium]
MSDHGTRTIEFNADKLETMDARRRFLSTLAIAAGAVALSPMIMKGMGIGGMLQAQGDGQTEPNLTDTDILNYARTLEYLEATFYLRADSGGTLPGGATVAGIDPDGMAAPGSIPGLSAITAPAPSTLNVPTFFRSVRDHEITHVLALQSALGAAALARSAFAFSFGAAFASAASFMATAQALEDTGVTAYLGQAGNIDVVSTLGTAGTILGVEAEHASTVRLIGGQPVTPGDASFDTPQTTTQVLAIASGFITQAPPLPFPK